jgi:phosphoribosylanthranilate isomerase
MSLKLKVCGMRDSSNIAELAGLKPDFMGFIFYPPSKRFAGELDEKALAELGNEIKRVGVFVNAPVNEIIEKVKKYRLDAVQLHGDEMPEVCSILKENGLTVIKVFSVADTLPENLNEYKPYVDYFLFDTKTEGYGGSGKKFSWEVLKDYDNEIPLILSGGIGPDSADEIRNLKGLNLYGVDINSRFETEPGLKDVKLVEDFKKKLLV